MKEGRQRCYYGAVTLDMDLLRQTDTLLDQTLALSEPVVWGDTQPFGVDNSQPLAFVSPIPRPPGMHSERKPV